MSRIRNRGLQETSTSAIVVVQHRLAIIVVEGAGLPLDAQVLVAATIASTSAGMGRPGRGLGLRPPTVVVAVVEVKGAGLVRLILALAHPYRVSG